VKLWIDDLREDPDTKWAGASEPEGWKWAKTSERAIAYLFRWLGPTARVLEEVAFDHDLGGDDTTRPVLLWMIENDVWPKVISIHTANPVGREWLRGTALRYAPARVEVRG
jgi:hypothetical protein